MNEGGQEVVFAADTIITCFGLASRRSEVDKLREATDAKVVVIGDCLKTATMYEAGTHGFWAGYSIFDTYNL